PRKEAPDKSGSAPCSARHEFHAVAPSLSSLACSSFVIVRPRQCRRQPGINIAMRPDELGLRQPFSAAQIGAREVRAIEPRPPKIGVPQIGAAQRGVDQEGTAEPRAAEIRPIQPRGAKSCPPQVYGP